MMKKNKETRISHISTNFIILLKNSPAKKKKVHYNLVILKVDWNNITWWLQAIFSHLQKITQSLLNNSLEVF